MENIISIRRLISIDDVIDRIRMMKEFASSENLAFDFSSLQYVKTVPAALFAREFRLLIADRQSKCLKTYSAGHDYDKSVALSYLAFIGFFDFIGLANVG